MTKRTDKNSSRTSPRRFVLTSSTGAKISAVEGMTISRRMGEILKTGARDGLSGDERRSLIRDAIGRR